VVWFSRFVCPKLLFPAFFFPMTLYYALVTLRCYIQILSSSFHLATFFPRFSVSGPFAPLRSPPLKGMKFFQFLRCLCPAVRLMRPFIFPRSYLAQEKILWIRRHLVPPPFFEFLSSFVFSSLFMALQVCD